MHDCFIALCDASFLQVSFTAVGETVARLSRSQCSSIVDGKGKLECCGREQRDPRGLHRESRIQDFNQSLLYRPGSVMCSIRRFYLLLGTCKSTPLLNSARTIVAIFTEIRERNCFMGPSMVRSLWEFVLRSGIFPILLGTTGNGFFVSMRNNELYS